MSKTFKAQSRGPLTCWTPALLPRLEDAGPGWEIANFLSQPDPWHVELIDLDLKRTQKRVCNLISFKHDGHDFWGTPSKLVGAHKLSQLQNFKRSSLKTPPARKHTLPPTNMEPHRDPVPLKGQRSKPGLSRFCIPVLRGYSWAGIPVC